MKFPWNLVVNSDLDFCDYKREISQEHLLFIFLSLKYLYVLGIALHTLYIDTLTNNLTFVAGWLQMEQLSQPCKQCSHAET